MDDVLPHFNVSTAFFCPCFFHQFLKSLQEKQSCSLFKFWDLLRVKNVFPQALKCLKDWYIYILCFDHLLQQFAQIILQLFVFIIEGELLPVLRLKEAIMKYWFYFAYFVLKNIHFVFWNISQGSCPWVFLHGKIEI